MIETKGYIPEEYKEFKSLNPEDGDKEITEKRNSAATNIKESILAIKNFKERFRSKSELGAFIINTSLNAMQSRVGEADARWIQDVKGLYMKLTGGSEASWSGVLGEFTAARMIEKSGNTARFPGNIPEGMEKPRGYNKYTQAEQDRLQGIDWWLDKENEGGNISSFAVTVKSMPFTPEGIDNNKYIYNISEAYEQVLGDLINSENVESRDGAESPTDRYNKTIEACEKVRLAAEQYGTEALLMVVPSLGNSSDIDRHTGEPSDEITEFFSDNLSEIAETNDGENTHETIDK